MRTKATSLALTFLVCLLVTDTHAQNAQKLAKLKLDLQVLIDSLQQINGFPGLTLSVILPSKQQLTLATGLADSLTLKPMEPTHRMLSGSNGKTLFTAAALILASQEYYNLDDKIEKFLKDEPWFYRLPNAHTITMRMLMNHTSGIEEYYGLGNFMELVKENPSRSFEPLETLEYVFDRAPLLEEVEGLAAGSGQSLNDVFAFQLIDEYWGYLDRLQHNSIDKDHCTAIGIAGNGNTPTLIAQNIDIDNFMNGYQVLLHIKEEKATPEQFIMSCAGFIGFSGMNNKNVAVVINALTDLNNSITGLPVTFVTRGILQQKAPHEALDFVQKVKHATGQNYLIGTPDKVYTFEASANQVVQFNPRDNNVVYHTNHSLNNHDVKPWMEEYHKRILSGQGKQTNSQTRFSSVERQLAAQALTLNAGNIKQILSSKENSQSPICVSYREEGVAFTFSSVIFSLGNRPMAEITMGPPDTNAYKKYFLEM